MAKSKNEFNEIGKFTKKILKSRMDIISKLILLSIVAVPILVFVGVLAVCYVVKLFMEARPKLKVKTEKLPKIPPTDTIYYDVRKVCSSKYSLTQYVSFFVAQGKEFVDVTKSMKALYPELKFYSGITPKYRGTVVLRDYDIVKLKKELGKINLVRTVKDV